jgi:hypothetical protein
MKVELDKDNVHLFAHAFCFVSDHKQEGYLQTDLNRSVKVENIETRDYLVSPNKSDNKNKGASGDKPKQSENETKGNVQAKGDKPQTATKQDETNKPKDTSTKDDPTQTIQDDNPSSNDNQLIVKLKLNVEDPTDDELKTIFIDQSKIDKDNKSIDTSKSLLDLKGDIEPKGSFILYKLTIQDSDYDLAQISHKAYVEGKEKEGVVADTYMFAPQDIKVRNVRNDSENMSYISEIDPDRVFYVRADADLEDGTGVTVGIYILDKNGSIIHTESKKATVKDMKIEESFMLSDIAENKNIEWDNISQIKGFVKWIK